MKTFITGQIWGNTAGSDKKRNCNYLKITHISEMYVNFAYSDSLHGPWEEESKNYRISESDDWSMSLITEEELQEPVSRLSMVLE